jgi:putative DNA primase/helicase
MENYASVVDQMRAFGVEFRDNDLPLHIPTPKRKTCGVKGKWWYWLQVFRRRDGKEYVVGKFGTYKHGGSEQKVDVDWKEISAEERERMRREHEAAAARARQAKDEAAQLAAMSAADVWARASRVGRSPYLERKGVEGEACRYLADGTVVIPLLRYDKPREEALRAVQRIQPDGFKLFTKGFAKTGCSVRLGEIDDATALAMVCEGYATGLSIRMATGRRWPVFVALDAYNLAWAIEILRPLYPRTHFLVCADDDWKSEDHEGPNPGRRKAKAAAKTTPHCDIVWPVFNPDTREEKDTDFNDLHLRQGLDAVGQQLLGVIGSIEKGVRIGR